jgi:pantoate--beta-alanine ligase
MYGATFQTAVQVKQITQGLCGASRPGHFEGVTTVVCKLFHIVKPHLAVFGAKDYQQAMTIRRMIIDLDFDIDLDLAPIVREESGLALSSRNEYLSPEERREAAILFQSLRLAERLILQGERDPEKVLLAMQAMIDAVASSKIDYIALVDPETLTPVQVIDRNIRILLAVYIGKTRLIDNYLVELSTGID